jgi:hypothetical protein
MGFRDQERINMVGSPFATPFFKQIQTERLRGGSELKRSKAEQYGAKRTYINERCRVIE